MILRSLRRFRRNSAGATAVEFALVAGPLFLMLFGTVEFARLEWTREAIQSAALAGARCMGVRQTECAPKGAYSPDATIAYVQERATALYISVGEKEVSVDAGATCAGSDNFAEVVIRHTFQSAMAGVLGMLTAGVDLTASACFPNQEA